MSGIDPLELRLSNMLKEGDALAAGGRFEGENPLPAMVQALKQRADFEKRRGEKEMFNEVSVYRA